MSRYNEIVSQYVSMLTDEIMLRAHEIMKEAPESDLEDVTDGLRAQVAEELFFSVQARFGEDVNHG